MPSLRRLDRAQGQVASSIGRAVAARDVFPRRCNWRTARVTTRWSWSVGQVMEGIRVSHLSSAAQRGGVRAPVEMSRAESRRERRAPLAMTLAFAAGLLAAVPARAQAPADWPPPARSPFALQPFVVSSLDPADSTPAQARMPGGPAPVTAATAPGTTEPDIQAQEAAAPAANQAAPADGQASAEPATAAQAPAEPAAAAPDAPARTWPPMYMDRRFEENWEPHDWTAPRKGARNVFDKIKAIPLNDSGSVWVGFGGQGRIRRAYQSTITYGGPFDFESTMWTLRFRGHTDLHIGKHFRVFGEYMYSNSSIQALVDTLGAPDARLGADAPNVNGDMLNLFAEFSSPFGNGWQGGAWAGRRELQMGHERILSPGNWLLNRHTFDGAGGWVGNSKHRVEGFVTRPHIAVPDRYRDLDDDRLWGVFYTTTGVRHPRIVPEGLGPPGRPQQVVFQPYLLDARRKNVDFVQGRADENRYTLGMLAYGDVGGTGFDFEFEGIYQTGRFETARESGDINAHSWTGEFGYRFTNVRFMPRPYLSFDYASGDSDPSDGKLGTFDPLYPLAYAFFGFHAALDRKNFVATGVQVDAVLAPNLYFKSTYFPVMRRAQSKDGVYNTFGGIARLPLPPPGGVDPSAVSMNIGQQWGFSVAWQATPQLLLYGTYLRLFTGQFWADTQTNPAVPMNALTLLTQFNF